MIQNLTVGTKKQQLFSLLLFDSLIQSCFCECPTVERKLFNAAQDGRVPELSSLLRDHPEINVNWANPSYFKWTALHTASHDGYVEVVKLLLAHPNINVNQPPLDDTTPFYLGA